jgi:glycosyltransferase involved in cell wall biosynthesis
MRTRPCAIVANVASAPHPSGTAMISVVIPAYNEAAGIGSVLDELRQILGAPQLAGAQIIVVDDGSADATAERATAGGAHLVVRHAHNLGYGRSIKDGIAAATHDVIVIADADGSYPVAEIPRLVQRFHDGFDMVVGARSGPNYQESAIKAPLRGILKFLVEFTAGRRVPDVNSGMRVFSKATVSMYVRHLSNSFSFTTSLTLAYMLTGRFVTYEPIDYRPRIGTTNVRLVRDSLRTLQYIVHSITIFNPIKLFLLLSLACALIAVVCFVLTMADFFPGGGIATVLALLAAIVVFALGLLADLIQGSRFQ